MSDFTVEPLIGACGARIHGIDLNQDCDQGTIAALRQVWLDRLVLIFPGQDLAPARQMQVAAWFGRPCVNPYVAGLPDFPEVIPIVKEPQDKLNFGGDWHTDQTFEAVPPQASLLQLREAPSHGGDTIWANAYAAFETLSPPMQRFVDGLTAEHDAADSYAPSSSYATGEEAEQHSMTVLASAEAARAVVHPVVVRHPETRRKLLFVNELFTKRIRELSEPESKAVLTYLTNHVHQPDHVMRHRWTVGDVVLWDNRATQHRAMNDYHGQRRVAHRVTIAQEPAAWSRAWPEAAE